LSIHLSPGSRSPAPEYLSPLAGPNFHADLAGSQEWSSIECARALYRRRATLLWITCIGILGAALVSVAQPRMYQSQASLEIQGVNENFLNLRDIYPTAAPSATSDGTYVQTQAEILQQDSLIEQVARKLRLDERREFQTGPTLWDRLRPSGGPGPSPAPDARNAIEAVKDNVKIVPSRGSRIVRIVCDARNPQLAADIANTLAETFIEQSIEARRRAARQTQESLSLQLEALRNKLLKSEAELRAQGRLSGVISGLSQGQSGVVSGLAARLTYYNTLKREVDANRKFYEAMSQRVADAGVASAVSQSNIRLVGPAQSAAYPYKPNLPLNLAIGTFGGLVLAIGYVMLQAQNNSVLRAPGEAGMYLTLPELGAIPKAANGSLTAGRLLSSGHGKMHVERATLEQRYSVLSESFRATLASILADSRNGDHPRILVVTSSGPMEGKTTVVSNLGIALTEISGRVLLIDGDMRRPRLHKVFDQANSWGLSDVLREKNAIEELPLDVLVKKTSVPHLYLLPSGAGADNIFGLLCSGRMARLLPRFRREFDYVLVDAPPCLEFADARIMARCAEKVLLVVRANYTDRKTAQAAVQRLLLDGISVMGVILNRWDPARSDIYGYYGLNHRGLA
jgi:polysaccharide biosynthesis transport protein